MPFALNESTEFISPTKTLEYMAAGKPVVSTPIHDVEAMFGDIVAIAADREGFIAACRAGAGRVGREKARARRAHAEPRRASTPGTPPPRRSAARSTPCWRRRADRRGRGGRRRTAAEGRAARAAEAAGDASGRRRSQSTDRSCARSPPRADAASRRSRENPGNAQLRGAGGRCAALRIDPIATGERPVTDSEPAHPNPQLQRARWTSLERPVALPASTTSASFTHPSEIARWEQHDRGAVPARVGGQRHRRPRLSSVLLVRARLRAAARRRPRDPALRRRRLLRAGSGSTASSRPRTRAATRRSPPTSRDCSTPSGRQTRDGDGRSTTRTTSPSRAASRTGRREPHAIWYPRTTGIWQTVWIERVGRTYVDKIRWTPHVESYAIALRGARRRRPGRGPVDRGDAAPRRARCSRATATR